ncbi:NAD-dependent epimerase/dehydratase family protein, partial [Rhodopseudomonas sp. B29]|uniref:NAD-dependent epimerase/dehydratase family protein n=1 Tax=Rhodopseudomonas sp. B29 TaxID=95607 RepID=UPI0035E3D6C7
MAGADRGDLRSGFSFRRLGTMTRRAIVTGATGFIGRNTLEPLRQLGFEVHVLGR